MGNIACNLVYINQIVGNKIIQNDYSDRLLVKPNDQTSYPHAKCLVVDRSFGYLGSANFTGQGMKGHFELGVSLNSEASKTLGDLLQYLWSQTNIFTLAWTTADH